MSRRASHRPNALDDYLAPPIKRSTSEHNRMLAEHTLESHLSAVYEPSPAGTEEDLSVEYGRVAPISPERHEASFISFAARGPPHNVADYDHIDDHDYSRYPGAELDDSLGLSNLDISKSSLGHHVSNVTLRAGFGGKASSPTASNIAFEPSRDVEEIRRGGVVWGRDGREVRDDTPRAARAGRLKLADALPANFSPKRAAGEISRKRPLAASSPKYSTRATLAASQETDTTASPPAANMFAGPSQEEEQESSSAFGRQARGLRRDMALAEQQAHTQAYSTAPTRSKPSYDTPQPPQPSRNTKYTRHAYSKADSIQLPDDLTGLTSAVVTPAKPHLSHVPFVAPAASPMEKEVQQEKKRHREAQARIGEQKDGVERLTRMLEEKEREVQALQRQLRAEGGRGSPVQSRSKANTADDRIAQLEREIETLTKENRGLRHNLGTLGVELARAEETLRQQGFVLEELRAERQRDDEKLNASRRVCDRTFNDLRRKQQEVARLTKDVGRLRKQYDTMKEEWERHLAEEQQKQQERRARKVEVEEYEEESELDEEEDYSPPPAPVQAQGGSDWRAERRQLSAVEEEEEDEEPLPDQAQRDPRAPRAVDVDHNGLGIPDLSGGSVSSFGTPIEPPEPDSPRFNESFHNTSIVSNLAEPVAGPSQAWRKPFVPMGDIEGLANDVEERRSVRSADSSRGSPAPPSQQALPEHQPTRQRPSSAPPLAPAQGRAKDRARPPSAASAPGLSAHHGPHDARLPRPRLNDERVERLFDAPGAHDAVHCKRCRHSHAPAGDGNTGRTSPCAVNIAALVNLIGKGNEGNATVVQRAVDEEHRRRAARDAMHAGVPSQELVTIAIQELEADFTHYRSVYTELADQYGVIPAKNRLRRNILAEHLGEVISILERKGDLIATLYDLIA